jgi:hypothetical protein
MVLTRFPTIDFVVGHRIPIALSLKLVSTADHGVGMSTRAMDGRVHIIAARRVGGYPIVVATIKTAATIYAGWWQTAAFVIAISALTVITIAAFASLFIRQFRSYRMI